MFASGIVVMPMVASCNGSQRPHGGAAGGANRLAVRGEDAGENSSLLGTTSMTHGCHFLLEGDVEHLQCGRCLLRGPVVSPASSARVFNMVSVKFGPAFDRIPHPDVTLEESISEIWNQRLQRNPSLYNGTKFRYGGNAMHYKDDSKQDYHVSLHLGLTDYRTFVGTNLNPLWEKFLVPSEDDPVRCQHMSNPLGNGAIVETSDQKIIVLQRSHNVGEFPGYYVFPGGHSEPQEIGIMGHQTDEEDSTTLSEQVSVEMFEGIIREVVEETGVPATSLTDPVFIGVSCREMNVRPTAFFFTKCNIDSSGVNELYSKAQDGYESTKLYAVSMEELRGMSQRMPGCHNGGFALYELMRNDTKSL